MKTKKILNKKLVLKKNTIANLNNGHMKDLKGGGFTDTCKPQICNSLECTGTPCEITEYFCSEETCYQYTCQCATVEAGYTCLTECPYVTCN